MKDFVSKVMAVGAIIVWVLCFILGLVTLLLGSVGTAIGLWLSGFIGGCVYLALDQILSSQDAILENQKKLFAQLESLKQPPTPKNPPCRRTFCSPCASRPGAGAGRRAGSRHLRTKCFSFHVGRPHISVCRAW